MKSKTDFTRIFIVIGIVAAFVVSLYFITRQQGTAPVCTGKAGNSVSLGRCNCVENKLIQTANGMVKGFQVDNSCYFCAEGETISTAGTNPRCVKEKNITCDASLSGEYENSCDKCGTGYYFDSEAKAGQACKLCTWNNILPAFTTNKYGDTGPVLNKEFKGKCYSEIVGNANLFQDLNSRGELFMGYSKQRATD